MTSRSNKPFHADQVGSLLRPARIKEARERMKAGLLSGEELRSIEDQEISKIIQKQKEIGIQSITDGELRRGWWHLDFLEHLAGVEGYIPDMGYNQAFKGTHAPAYNVRVVAPISFHTAHPFLRDFSFVQEHIEESSDFVAKATIPSPTMLYRQEILSNDGSSLLAEVYPNLQDFYNDLIQTYREAVQAFYNLGCRYLQFDDTNWAFLADPQKCEELKAKGLDIQEVKQVCVSLINEVLKDKPKDLTITTHICRGNFASSWLFSGGYGPVAKELFETNYDGFFLEYDSERSGDFEPLKNWKNSGSKIVLGLVTSKFPELEDKQQIKQRIEEATKYIPLESLCLSPQCGFASTEEGNHLTEEEQWKKLHLIKEIAKEIWK